MMARRELELVTFSGPTSKYDSPIFGCALKNLAGSARPGEDWRPAFTRQGVEQELDLLVQQGHHPNACAMHLSNKQRPYI